MLRAAASRGGGWAFQYPSPKPVSGLSQKYPDAAFRYAGPPFGRSVKLTPQMARISSPIGPTGVK